MQTAKIMHGWLPVMHILLAHTMGISQCPGCPHPDETIDHHLFQCPNRTLSEECSSLLSSLRKEGLKLGWPRPVLDGIIQLIQDFIEGSPPTLSGGSNCDRRSVTPMWFPLKSMDRDSGGFSCAIPTGQDHFLFMPPLAGIYGQIMAHPK